LTIPWQGPILVPESRKEEIEMAEYAGRLREALDAFDTRPRPEALWVAENLTMVLHAAEAAGYELTEEEDILWLNLTAKVLDE
jgi:hypothetical protein